MEIEERVISVEEALAKFIERSGEILAANREDIASIREGVAEIRASSARTDRQLLQLQQQADKDRAQAEKEREQDRAQAEKQREQDLAQAEKRREQDRQQAEQEREQDRRQAEQERRDFNKRLAELSDSMGTLVEDMVAPCGFKLARAIFGDQEAETCGIRLKARHPVNRGELMELDLLAVGPSKVLVVEVKRRMDAAKAEEYRQKLARLPEFFPALAGKTLCAAVASVYLEPSVVAFLNRQKLYGIAMGDEIMEVVNLGQF